MSASTRFACPSCTISLTAVLARTSRTLWYWAVLALALHVGTSQWSMSAQRQQVAKPLTTRFVKRSPRLAKPLELRKRPQPRQRRLKRVMVSTVARLEAAVSDRSTALPPVTSLAKPVLDLRRDIRFTAEKPEPSVRAQALHSARRPKAAVNMSLEMIDVQDLDTGRHQAMVIQDPTDKRNVRGYFHIARVYAQSAAKAEARMDWKGSPFALAEALPHLMGALNKYTQIEADISGTYTFSSGVFLETPLIFVCSHAGFQLSRSEAENLGTYLAVGGFLYSDTLINNADVNHHSIRQMWVDALQSRSLRFERDWSFDKIPNEHGLYHCYFDFAGPPLCHNIFAIRGGGSRHPSTFTIPDYLEGVFLEGRLLGIMTPKNYSAAWAVWPEAFGLDNTKQLQFGVNLIIFALIQEGSITRRVMDAVR